MLLNGWTWRGWMLLRLGAQKPRGYGKTHCTCVDLQSSSWYVHVDAKHILVENRNKSMVITCRRLLFVERPLNVLGRISTQRFKLFHSNVCERLNMNAPLDARRIARFYHFGGYEVRGYGNRWCTLHLRRLLRLNVLIIKRLTFKWQLEKV